MTAKAFNWKKAVAQESWKLFKEESWAHESPRPTGDEMQWYWQLRLPCGGFIGLYDDDPPILRCYTFKSRKNLITLSQEFAAQGAVLDLCDPPESGLFFPPALLDQVATRLHARRKRRLSENTLLQMSERLKKYHAQKAEKSLEGNTQKE